MPSTHWGQKRGVSNTLPQVTSCLSARATWRAVLWESAACALYSWNTRGREGLLCQCPYRRTCLMPMVAVRYGCSSRRTSGGKYLSSAPLRPMTRGAGWPSCLHGHEQSAFR